MTTRAQARDDISGKLKAAVDAYLTANAGKSCDIFWDDVDKAQSAGSIPHMRAFVKHGEPGGQTLGGVGRRRFTRAGVVIVQVMTPFGDGFTLDDVLATVARNAFEGVSTPNGVWFRRVTAREVGKTGGFHQTNVTAHFEYTETR